MITSKKGAWSRVPLGTLAEFRNGVNFSKENFGTGIRVIGVGDFQDNVRASYDVLDQINPDGVVRKEHLLKDGDILFVRSNGNRELIGRSMYVENVPGPVTHSAFSIRLRFISERCHPRFYAYLFRSQFVRQALSLHGSGTNISNLNQDILGRLEVPIPQLSDQERIAAILASYDDLIDNNNRRIKILERMAQMLYREWFVNFRFPSHEKVKLVESKLGTIPETWQITKLGDIAQVTDYVANGSFASLKENVTYSDTPDYAILIRTKDNTNGWNGEYIYVNEHAYTFLRKSALARGDLIVSNVGNVGTVFSVPDLGKPMTLGPNAVLIRYAAKKYLLRYLRSDVGQQLIRGITSGSAQPKFNKTELRNSVVAIPPKHLLNNYEQAVSPIDDEAELLRQKNANLRTTRDLLLPRLVFGEIGMVLMETQAVPATV